MMKKIIFLIFLLHLDACIVQRDLPSDCFYKTVNLDSVSTYKINRLNLNNLAQIDSNFIQIIYISDDPELENIVNYRVWIFYDRKTFHWFLFDGMGRVKKTMVKPMEKISATQLVGLADSLIQESKYRIRDCYGAGGIHARLFLFIGTQLIAGFESVGYSCALQDEKPESAKAVLLTKKILKLSQKFLNESDTNAF